MVHIYLQFFLKGSACIVGELVMHPCVPFCSGAPPTFFVAPCTPVEEHCPKQRVCWQSKLTAAGHFPLPAVTISSVNLSIIQG